MHIANRFHRKGAASIVTLFIVFLFFAAVVAPKYIVYKRSSYKSISGNSFLKTFLDLGNYGEYLTFLQLTKIPGYKIILTNLYLPKEDGTTTEIDLLMLYETGIYVFESKNYSGWIFGDEKSRYWTQTLESGEKNRFFNPIWQNKAHIKALVNMLPGVDESICKSYIIFSERCELKKIVVGATLAKVINRQDLIWTLKDDISNSPKLLTREKIDEIFATLQKFTLAGDDVKRKHIESIMQKRSFDS